MQSEPTLIIHAGHEVDDSLRRIGLSREIAAEIARKAAAARAEALPAVDPVSAPGLLSYIHGARAIRLTLMKLGWKRSRIGNVESTVNHELGVQLLFQNVDSACNVTRSPRAISGNGSGSRQLVADGQGELFEKPSKTGTKLGVTPTVWFLCVYADDKSVRAEVSRPTSFEGNQFSGFHERIFVLDESYHSDPSEKLIEPEELDDLDVQVSRK